MLLIWSLIFFGAKEFNKDYIINWDTSEVTNMSDMFYKANSLHEDNGD